MSPSDAQSGERAAGHRHLLAKQDARFRLYLIDTSNRILVRHEVSAETLADAIEIGFDLLRAVHGSRYEIEIWSGTQRLFRGSPDSKSAQANSPTRIRSVRHWELRAEEVRVLAEAMNSPDAKRAMQDICRKLPAHGRAGCSRNWLT